MTDFAVSVVIPLFNKERFIRATLLSALAQSHPAKEIIVVDDHSTDDSVAVIEDLLGERVRLVRQTNAGPGPARNRGIAAARGEWVAFLDADDLWTCNHLSTLAEVVADYPDAVVLSAAHRRFVAGQLLPDDTRPTAPRRLDFWREARESEAIWTSAVAVRRDVLDASGGFLPICPGEDQEFWVRLALNHDFASSDRVTAFYRQDTAGLIESGSTEPIPNFELGPIYRTLNGAALSLPDGAKRTNILQLRDHLLIMNVRQMLVRRAMRQAREFLKERRRFEHRCLPLLELLARLPAAAVGAALSIRRRLKSR